jgi:hypothetical protein
MMADASTTRDALEEFFATFPTLLADHSSERLTRELDDTSRFDTPKKLFVCGFLSGAPQFFEEVVGKRLPGFGGSHLQLPMERFGIFRI